MPSHGDILGCWPPMARTLQRPQAAHCGDPGGASRQCCRLQFMHNLLAHVPKQAQAMVATLIRTISVQPHGKPARQQLEQVADTTLPQGHQYWPPCHPARPRGPARGQVLWSPLEG